MDVSAMFVVMTTSKEYQGRERVEGRIEGSGYPTAPLGSNNLSATEQQPSRI
jgi:hypothetical protein